MKKINLRKIFTLIKMFGIFTLISINTSFAQDATRNFKTTADNITNNVLASLGTLLMTAAVMFFFYGVVVFIVGRVTGKGDLKELNRGKEFMLWGLIALFVMVSAWGIIRMAQGLLEIKPGNVDIKPVQFSAMSSGSIGGGGGGGANPADNIAKKPTGNFGCTFDNECSTGQVCRNGTCGAPVGSGNPIQKSPDGVTRENPFGNTVNYPVIKEGSTNVSAGASSDGKAFTLLVGLLKKKSCTQAVYNGVTYNLNSGFGTTYEGADLEFVKLFQRRNGLGEDGVVGKSTWEALSVTTGQKTTFTGITVKDCW